MTATIRSASDLVLVDSFGWIQFFGDEPGAESYYPYLDRLESLLVPTIVLYEVLKKIYRSWGDTQAQAFLSRALRARVVPLDERLAVAAVEISLTHKLAMGDAIIYATARHFAAELVTSDPHFQNLPGVTII
ncbi:MAG: type II toxin-antitoxin system VapC family toxin [Candidatus Acidiferrales bacterium]